MVPESIDTPQWEAIGNSSGRGVLTAKLLEEKYEVKMEFPRGKGGQGEEVQNKKPSVGGVSIFPGTAQIM